MSIFSIPSYFIASCTHYIQHSIPRTSDIPQRGRFLVVEGLDRCGKDTQITILLNKIPNSARISFPNEQIQSGQRCRQYLTKQINLSDREVNALFALNRRETMQWIDEQILKGITVICSRYALSGVAYTCAKGQVSIEDAASDDRGIIVPDVTIVLFQNPDEISARYDQSERYESAEFQKKVLSMFREVEKMSGIGKVVEINAKGGIDEVAERVWEVVRSVHVEGELKYGLFGEDV